MKSEIYNTVTTSLIRNTELRSVKFANWSASKLERRNTARLHYKYDAQASSRQILIIE